jgi:archaellum biogenesis protein FlaJ (TadC family)
VVAAPLPLSVASWLKLYCVLAMQMGSLSKPMVVKRCKQDAQQHQQRWRQQHQRQLRQIHALQLQLKPMLLCCHRKLQS